MAAGGVATAGPCMVCAGGFDGRNGWVQSKLQIKPTISAMPTGTLRTIIGTRSSKALAAPKA